MPAPARAPAQRQEDLKVLSFATVQGMDTREERSGIGPGFWSWLLNFQPIGTRTLRALNGKAATAYTLMSDTIVSMMTWQVNSSTKYIVIFTEAGAAYQINASTGASTTIGTSGTFYDGSNYYPPQAVAFGNSGILIISTLGYWAWDGTNLYAAGATAPSWLVGTGGSSFTAQGTYTNGSNVVTGVSSTAGIAPGMLINTSPFPATVYVGAVSANSFTLLEAGSSYTVGTSGNYTFNFNTLELIAQATNGTNALTLISTSPLSLGMGVSASGLASGTTVTQLVSSTGITVSNNFTGSSGYIAVTFSEVMPSGITGNGIEVYNGQVWIVNGRTILASAPGDGTNFSTSAGGVSLTVKDSYVQDGYAGLKQLDGFLYLFAHSACDVISDVQTSGSPPTTTFLRINVSPLIGSPWRDTIVQLPSSIAFANSAGVYEVSGGQTRKVSAQFDGVFESATYPTFPSAAIATLNKVVCYCLTLTMTDPDGGTSASLGIWDGQKWFLASQESAITTITTMVNDSVMSPWATNGTALYNAFASASTTLPKKAKSWFASPGAEGITERREAQRVYAQFGNTPPAAVVFSTFNIDYESGSVPAGQVTAGLVTWVNDNEQVVTWQNGSSQTVTWQTGVFPLVTGANATCIGLIFGLTVVTSAATLDIIGLFIGYLDYSRYD